MNGKPILGVQMYTLRKFTQDLASLDDALRRVREIGYRSIQVSGLGAIAPGQVADCCARYELEIGGTHVAWDRFLNDLDGVIAEHRLWNCRHAAIGMIPPAEYLSLDGLDRFVTELAPVAERLAEHGIDFSYHNHAHEFVHFDGRPWLAHLLERASAEQLKVELDVHWVAAGGGDPAAWISACGARMPLLHLKDFKLNGEFKRIFAPVGEGNLNWPAILAAAAAQPIDYYFVEQDACYGEDEFDCLRRSYEFLRAAGLR
jgi:sugar phosphate isomerase/epimerase